jgi:hypothetical protein
MTGELKLLDDAEGIVCPRPRRKRRPIAGRNFDRAVRELRRNADNAIGAFRARNREPAVDRGGENDALVIVGVIAEELYAPRRVS